MPKEQQGQQLVFKGKEMQEVAQASFLRQSLIKLLSNAEKHEAQNRPYSLIRKRALGSKENFVVGYLKTDASCMKEEEDEGDSNGQVVAFIHSRSSDEILIITRDPDNADSKTDPENQDLKMFILPWPPIELNKDKKIIDIVEFLIQFTEKAFAWDEFESRIPSVGVFIQESFLRQKDLENIKFK